MKKTKRASPKKPSVSAPDAVPASVDEVREHIRNRIHQSELLPGERINEQALALHLGVGRATAREALRSLEQAGLVRIVPNRGAEVRKLSLEEALQLYDIRAGLARTSGRLIALRVTADDEKHLVALLEEMDVAADERDHQKYHNLNAVFHKALMQITKSPRLISLNDAVEDEIKLYLHKGVFTPAQMRASRAEHRKILAAILGGDAEAAAEAFEQHILTGKQRMLNTIGGESAQSQQVTEEDSFHV